MYTAYSRRIRQVRKATQTPRDLMMFLVSGFIDHLYSWYVLGQYHFLILLNVCFRHLQSHIPPLEVLPMKVSINVLDKSIHLSDLLLAPADV